MPKRRLEGLEGLTPGKWQASTPIRTKKAFRGFGRFDAWQTAGFNAIKIYCLEGLEGLTPGKRQASTPISTKKAFGAFGGFDAWQTAGSNANKKLLVHLPAGLWVPKRRLEGLERLKRGKRQA